MTSGEIIIKLLVGQLIMIAAIWIGMLFFFSDMSEGSKIIFYIVTSWLLFLIVIIVKALIKGRIGKRK